METDVIKSQYAATRVYSFVICEVRFLWFTTSLNGISSFNPCLRGLFFHIQ